MAHTGRAERTLPQVPNYPIAAVVAAAAAVLVAAILILSAVGPFGLQRPSVEAPNPALVEAGARWELQRMQQSGDVDPLTEAQREWERQRRQQGAFR